MLKRRETPMIETFTTSDPAITEALRLERKGDYAGGLAALEKVQDKGSSEYYLRRGALLVELSVAIDGTAAKAEARDKVWRAADGHNLAEVYLYVGLSYVYEECFEVAQQVLKDALAIASPQRPDLSALAHIFRSMALLGMKRPQDALAECQSALHFAEALFAIDHTGSTYVFGLFHNQRSLAFAGLGMVEHAVDAATNAICCFEQCGNVRYQADALNNLGTYCARLGLTSHATEKFNDALHLAIGIEDARLVEKINDSINELYWHDFRLRDTIKNYVTKALADAKGDREKAADFLGLTEEMLRELENGNA